MVPKQRSKSRKNKSNKRSRSPAVHSKGEKLNVDKRSSDDSENLRAMSPPDERAAISRVSIKKVKNNLKNKGMINSERVR